MDANGSNLRRLTHGDVYDSDIRRFSENGTSIHFERRVRIGPNTIDAVPMTVNTDGSGLAERPRAETAFDREVVSPDGRFIVEREPDLPHLKADGSRFALPKAEKLWIREGKQGDRRFLTDGKFDFFAKDSKRVFFHTEPFGNSPIAVINVDGTGKKRLAIPEGRKSPIAILERRTQPCHRRRRPGVRCVCLGHE
jgi:hypothetical protein